MAPPATSPPLNISVYTSGKEVREILHGCGYTTLSRFVLLGKIRVLIEPGCTPLYHCEDAVKLASELPPRRRPGRASSAKGPSARRARSST